MSEPDPAIRAREIREQIAMKTSIRRRADNQGRPIGPAQLWQYDPAGRLIGRVDATPVTTEPEQVDEATRMPKPNPAQGAGGNGHTDPAEAVIQAALQAGKPELAIALKMQHHYEGGAAR